MNYFDMTDEELREAVTKIALSSRSEEEIRKRLSLELGYPYGADIVTYLPEKGDNIGINARSIVKRLGGNIMANGAMISMTIHGHNGSVSI